MGSGDAEDPPYLFTFGYEKVVESDGQIPEGPSAT